VACHDPQATYNTAQALQALDSLYHQSFEEDGGQSYEFAREQVERQIAQQGYTVSYAECLDAGAGAARYNYGGMRHVLVPLPIL